MILKKSRGSDAEVSKGGWIKGGVEDVEGLWYRRRTSDGEGAEDLKGG